MAEEKVVAATGTAGLSAKEGQSGGSSIERAMAEAAAQVQSEGISDPEEIRARMLEARQRMKTGAV